MNLTRINWPKGWRPSDDSVNGDPLGLLRCDNLTPDEDGALTLARGTELVTSVEGAHVTGLYSKYIDSDKYRFYLSSTGTVYKGTYIDSAWSFSSLFTGGSVSTCGFTSGLGFIYMICGNKRMKYNPNHLGGVAYNITPPSCNTGPTVQEAAKNDFSFGDISSIDIVDSQGTNRTVESNYIKVTSVDNKIVLQKDAGTPWNTMSFTVEGDTYNGLPTDLFHLVYRSSDKRVLKSVRLVFNLTDTWEPIENTFWYQWDNPEEGSPFPGGTDSWCVLKAERQQFNREGASGTSTEEDIGWHNIKSFRLIIEAEGEYEMAVVVDGSGMFFAGSDANSMNGLYEYMQVNVCHVQSSGKTIAKFKSKPSPASQYVTLVNGHALVTPSTSFSLTEPDDGQINEYWIYRRDVTYLQDVREIGTPRRLDQWYRVAVQTTTAQFHDMVSDETALIDNETYPIDPWSISHFTEDDLIGVSEPFNGRLVYLGVRDIYFSLIEDFGLYSPIWTVRLSGDQTEKNLWIKNVSTNQILVGTTLDVYEISGTCQELPDGTLDVRITPLGVEYPPVHKTVALDSGVLFYVASDGIRTITNSSQGYLSEELSLLFQGQTRHGLSPIDKNAPAYQQYALEVCQNRLWFSAALTDTYRKTFVYDLLKKRWWLWDQGPIYLYAEEDDTLLGGYLADGGVKILYTGNTVGGVGQEVQLLTIFDDNGQPRNRKDAFTLKVTADTGNSPVTIWLAKDSGGFTNLGNYSFNGVSEQLIEVATTVGIGFRYAFKITGTNLTTCKILNFTLEYDPRPEQLNYLRIPYDNLGTVSRKRFITYALVCDTLGNTISLTPLIDGVSQTISSMTLDRKGTHIHYFTSDTIGTDIGALLTGGTFEYYGLNREEIISEKLPVSTKYLLIPANDYGNPNRKRHSSYKFQIHTRGANVTFTPVLDGVSLTPSTVNTSSKRTHEHFFTSDTIGIDIGGILASAADTPFEFYGVIVPQEIEVLPPRLKEFRIPENNYGIPAKKRIRTMPMGINTNGSNVTFTPIVDGVSETPSIFNTTHRQTVLHYFTTDVFGIDFSGELIGTNPFEFYGLEKPVDVEVLPVGKKYDQVGPLDLDRLGKLMGFRIKVMTTGTTLPYSILVEDVEKWSGTITTTANALKTYEVMRVPKTILGSSMRIVFGPTADVFHRYWVKARVNISGNDTQIQEFSLQ